jgi:hypothetical protein
LSALKLTLKRQIVVQVIIDHLAHFCISEDLTMLLHLYFLEYCFLERCYLEYRVLEQYWSQLLPESNWQADSQMRQGYHHTATQPFQTFEQNHLPETVALIERSRQNYFLHRRTFM